MQNSNLNYETARKEIEDTYFKNVNILKIQLLISFLAALFFISLTICIYKYLQIPFAPLFIFISAFLTIIPILYIFDSLKKINYEKDLYKIKLNKLVVSLEKSEIYIVIPDSDYEKFDLPKIYISKKVITVFTFIIAFFAILYCILSHFLFTFNEKDWKEKEWKQKYIYEDLIEQQDISIITGGSNNYQRKKQPYNLYLYSKNEIRELLYDEAKANIIQDVKVTHKGDIINNIVEVFEYEYYCIFTDDKGINYWIVITYLNNTVRYVDSLQSNQIIDF